MSKRNPDAGGRNFSNKPKPAAAKAEIEDVAGCWNIKIEDCKSPAPPCYECKRHKGKYKVSKQVCLDTIKAAKAFPELYPECAICRRNQDA